MDAAELDHPLPLLITGLPGVIGFNCYHYFRSQLGPGVIGIKPAHTVALAQTGVYGISAEHSTALERLFRRYRFKTVIDASGCCALKTCEFNPRLAALINYEFGVRISAQARQYNARLIRFSSDLVFDGAGTGLYKEEDRVCPLTVYGKTMADAEAAILNQHTRTAIFRIPLPMGPSLNGHAGAVDWIEHRFARGNPATLYYDEVRSNLYIQDAIAVVEWFMQDFRPGIFHLGGPLPMTLYGIAQMVNKLGNYDPALLKGCWRHQAGPVPPRVGNVTLDCTKILRLVPSAMIKPWPLDRQYLPMGRAWHRQRTGCFPAGALKVALYGYDHATNPRSPLNWYGNSVSIDCGA